ncbi:hypothetical protein LTR56_027091 [Elasticomyces elasticus]|nr:hypothetical protein LTR56_027091 [Elasticomyces elasticus]KAK3616393.1 hypothetical protein LTR22_027091 [Elasticomyces elasticus]
MTSHSIQDLFRAVYPFRISLMEHLTATDLATLCYAFELSLTQQEWNVYLLPFRDLPKQREWIESRVEDGAKVTMMSKDLPLWLMRMQNPHRYWSMYTTHIVVSIWIIGPFSAEEQRKDYQRKENEIMPMSSDVYKAWIQHTNPTQYDIDHWDMFSITDWLIDHEDGYLANQRICNEHQLCDQNQDENWYVCSKSTTSPIEIVYTPLVDEWYIDMNWMPSGLIDHSGVKICAHTLTFPGTGTAVVHVEESTEHLDWALAEEDLHVMIKGKQRSSTTKMGSHELVIIV